MSQLSVCVNVSFHQVCTCTLFTLRIPFRGTFLLSSSAHPASVLVKPRQSPFALLAPYPPSPPELPPPFHLNLTDPAPHSFVYIFPICATSLASCSIDHRATATRHVRCLY
ncbi:hypothetical protein ABW19_dt0206188 [Dactylella cylindrospora]|nr:hypothetical protein ABW19_dt0206188 [Dactylella cylindrospora]